MVLLMYMYSIFHTHTCRQIVFTHVLHILTLSELVLALLNLSHYFRAITGIYATNFEFRIFIPTGAGGFVFETLSRTEVAPKWIDL